MKGKGGPHNLKCKYREVRQRTWGNWVTKIREPNGGKSLWLDSFANVVDAALAYDGVAKVMYGSHVCLNFPTDHIDYVRNLVVPNGDG